MPIKITSARDGFRRCGMAHSKQTTQYPDGKFSKKEIAILENESMLTVEVIDGKSSNGKNEAKKSLMALTVEDLKRIGEKYNCKETTKEKLVDEILAAQNKGS